MSTTTTTTSLQTKRPRARAKGTFARQDSPSPAARRTTRGLGFECAPTSVLDETRRRMKANMQAIASLLRFDAPDVPRDETEIVLTEMETRLNSMASLHRSLCRFGDFEQIDLAVYLRQAARLRNSPSRDPLGGGWAIESDGALIWVRDDEAVAGTAGGLDLALDALSSEARDLARRAAFASAILFPPWIFAWRSPLPGTSGVGLLAKPGEVGLRVRTSADGVLVEITVSDRGPGLPDQFDAKLQSKLSLELASVLARLLKGSFNHGPEAPAVFDVRFVPSYREGFSAPAFTAA